MSEWFGPVLDFIKSLWFLTVVMEWEGAVQMRRGRLHRVLTPGWYLVWPLMDTVFHTNVLTKTVDVGPLALTSRDDRSVTASAVVTWHVANVGKFLTECEDPHEVLHDAASGALAHAVLANEWVDIPHESFMLGVLKVVRKAAFRYGIEVDGMRWTGVVQSQPLVVWTVGTSPASVSAHALAAVREG